MAIDERRVGEIVERVVRELMDDGTGLGEARNGRAAAPAPAGRAGSGSGVFSAPEDAIAAAEKALVELKAGGIALRIKVTEAMRECARQNAEKWAIAARDETGMGRVDDKIRKNLGVANGTPGIEDLDRRIFKGDKGLQIVDGVPWGVICAITPSTNPTATVINNGLAMILAGNTVVFCPHPSGQECTKLTMADLNDAIARAGGPANLMTCTAEATLKNAAKVMKSERIGVIAATGGPGVVRAAMESNKKVFAAGPGNPPVLVDASADIDRAGLMTVLGSSFDNNLPCVSEKVGLAETRIFDDYLRALQRYGAQLLTPGELEKLLPVVLDGEQIKKDAIGQDTTVLLERAGLPVRGTPRLLVAEAPEDHPLVVHEQMMPLLPIVRVRDFDDGLRVALDVEHGFRHTAVLHSRNTEHIDRFIDTIGTTLTVINGPSYAWSGDEGEGYATMTVSTPTGEGVTSPRTWQRKRHLTYSGFLKS